MSDEFDDFVQDLQGHLIEETKTVYGETVFKRWLDPLYMGRIDHPDGHARVTGPCGETMEVFLRFEKGYIKEALFQTDGCGSSVVCGSFAAEMVRGKSPDGALEITGEAILKRLGGLPEADVHCAFLAGETLQEALNDYMIKQRKK